ncbi:MAG: flavodoxin family protein [Methanocella sp.]
MPVKVLAIDSSPGNDNENIAILLDPFLGGMTVAGADVELYHSRDLLIFPCCGNLNCTVRTPGNCMAHDDMKWLRPKIGQADILVLASPLYFNGLTGPASITTSMKMLLDRMAPGACPSADLPYEHSIHTTREPVSLSKVVLVSGCGFWVIDGFYPVLTHLKAFCHNTFPELAGSITGQCGVSLLSELPEGVLESEIVETARASGRRLVRGFHACEVPATGQVACDVRAGISRGRREWNGEMLYQF